MSKTTPKSTTAKQKKAGTPIKRQPVIQDEISTHEEELSRRIVPSQPEGGEPEAFDPVLADVTVTGQILEENPELAEQGLKEGDELQYAVDEADDDTLETLSRYKANYPDEEVFCISSDGQVFLQANHRDADAHEKTLTGKKAKKYRVD